MENTYNHTLLTKEQERALIMRYKRGDKDAAETLFLHNQRLVGKIAMSYFRHGLGNYHSVDDLMQYGNEGMLWALKKYDLERGVRFATYAVPWIRLYIRRFGLRDGVRVSTTFKTADCVVKVSAAYYRAENETGRHPTYEELAVMTNLSVQDVKEALAVSQAPVSLDAPAEWQNESADSEYHEAIGGDQIDLEDIAEHSMTVDSLHDAMRSLPHVYREIIRRTYGIGQKQESVAVIASRLNISEQAVRSKRQKAIYWLNLRMTNQTFSFEMD